MRPGGKWGSRPINFTATRAGRRIFRSTRRCGRPWCAIVEDYDSAPNSGAGATGQCDMTACGAAGKGGLVTDASAAAHRVFAFGDVAFSEDQGKFGASALYFDGGAPNGVDSHVLVPYDAAWFDVLNGGGANDWTVDLWLYPLSYPSGGGVFDIPAKGNIGYIDEQSSI